MCPLPCARLPRHSASAVLIAMALTPFPIAVSSYPVGLKPLGLVIWPFRFGFSFGGLPSAWGPIALSAPGILEWAHVRVRGRGLTRATLDPRDVEAGVLGPDGVEAFMFCHPERRLYQRINGRIRLISNSANERAAGPFSQLPWPGRFRCRCPQS